MSAERDVDVIVVGVGTMGSMALWRLARRGASVLGLERFEPGHDRGSGHGESRMIRSAYYEGPQYVPLVRSAFGLWRALEAESGEDLLTMTGALMIGTPDGPLVSGALRSAVEHGLTHRLLSPPEAARGWPQHRLAAGEVALWEEAAGVLRPERAILAAVDRARAHGARLRTGSRVLSVQAVAGRVAVATADRTFHARHAVVTVGPWLSRLLPGLRLPLVVERQVMAWFAAREPGRFAPARFPVFVHERGGTYGYGLPALDGATVKVAVHHQGRPVDPDEPGREITDADLAAPARLAADLLDGLEPRPVRARVCMYTNTPDEHFVVGPAPGLPGVTVLGGYSGHGFKFAPAMGEIAADLALAGRTDHPIGPFTPTRFR